MPVTDTYADQAQQLIRKWWFVVVAIGVLVGWGIAIAQSWPDPITARDVHQGRFNIAAAIPNDFVELQQTFSADYNGLYEIEVQFARYFDQAPNETGRLILQLRDNSSNILAQDSLPVNRLERDQSYKFQFGPVWDSAEKTYTLHIQGSDNQSISLWGYELDTYADGQFSESVPTSAVRDLKFSTRYQFSTLSQWQVGLELFGRYAAFSLFSLLILTLPGVWLHQQIRLRQTPSTPSDWLANWGIAVALGASLWPLLWLWITALRLRLAAWSLWIVVALLVLGVGVNGVRLLLRRIEGAAPSTKMRLTWHQAAMIVLLLVAYGTRLLAVRDLTFPAWVDASRHGLITAVMRDSGQILRDYGTYLDVDTPLYHFGFHTLSATLALLWDGALPTQLLVLGQLLNALIPLAAYAAGWQLTQRRGVGLVAAFLVAFVQFFPAYYVSWGRLTQLTGMLILPLLLTSTWALLTSNFGVDGGLPRLRLARWRSLLKEHPSWVIVSVLAAGLFLVHFRVFLLYIPFVAVAWLLRMGRNSMALVAAGLTAIVLIVPRIWQLASITQPESVFQPIAGYNDFPTAYLGLGWETPLIILAFACLLLAWLHASRRQVGVLWVLVLGVVVWVGLGEYLGRAPLVEQFPLLFDFVYLRTILVAVLALLTMRWAQSDQPNLPLALLLWAAFGFLVDMWWQHLLAVVGVTLLSAIANSTRRQGWAIHLWLLGLWVLALFGLLFGRNLGLPETWIINLNSMYITLYLPIGLAIAILAALLWDYIREQVWLVQVVGYLGIGLLLMMSFLFGAKQQVTVLNEATVLAYDADLPAIEWLDANLPPDAHIAVSSWKWLGSTWAAQDGGAWIVPLTGRSTTTPPADYAYSVPLITEVDSFNALAREIDDWSGLNSAEFLKNRGVTHIYIGARDDGFLKPDQLLRNPAATLIYQQDGAFIFELD